MEVVRLTLICCMPKETLQEVRFRLTRQLAQRTAIRKAQLAGQFRKGLRLRTFGNEDENDATVTYENEEGEVNRHNAIVTRVEEARRQ